MRFDWYQATVNEHPILLAESLQNLLAQGGQIQEGRGQNGYRQSLAILKADGDVAATVLCGGNDGASPNARASGEGAPAFAEALREHWPVHRVTRVDSAADMVGTVPYESLEGNCRRVAKAHRIKGLSYVPDDLSDGRTYQIGAPSSNVKARLYEKTAEQRKALPEHLHAEVPDEWVRLELQVMPRKEAGYVVATLEPAQVWGCSPWAWELARQLFSLEVSRVEMRGGRETNHQRAYRFMLQQYGATLRRMFADLGAWDCVGMTIGDDLQRIAENKRRFGR